MTVRSWAWRKCCDGIDIPRVAYIPTKTVGTYAPPANQSAKNYGEQLTWGFIGEDFYFLPTH